MITTAAALLLGGGIAGPAPALADAALAPGETGAGSAVAISVPGATGAAAAQAVVLESMERALFERTNEDRVARGLAPLSFDAELLALARNRAGAQVLLPRLSHTDITGQLAISRLLADGAFAYDLAGENLARLPGATSVTGVPAVAESAETALMNSELHRKNILETRFTSVAIGAVTDPSGRVIFAEIFRGA